MVDRVGNAPTTPPMSREYSTFELTVLIFLSNNYNYIIINFSLFRYFNYPVFFLIIKISFALA